MLLRLIELFNFKASCNSLFVLLRFTDLIEQNGGHAGQWLLEPHGAFAGLPEQNASLGGVGTGLDVLPVIDVVLRGASLAGIDVVREILAGLH